MFQLASPLPNSVWFVDSGVSNGMTSHEDYSENFSVISKYIVLKILACPGETTGVLNQESENKKMKEKSGRSSRKYLNSHEWFAALPAKTKTLISFHLLNQIKCANKNWKALRKSFPTNYRT